MNSRLKESLRPAARIAVRCLEVATGFKTDPEGYLPNRWRMVTGSYEPEVIGRMSKHLPPGGVFVDIGANVGYVSCALAERCGAHGTIRAFEPNPKVFRLLEENLRKFPQAKTFNLALGNQAGELPFYVGWDSCVGSLVAGYNEGHHGADKSGAIEKVIVKVQRGDDALASLSRIDVLKLDVEGYELEVLRGLGGKLERHEIGQIYFEYRPFAQQCAGTPPTELLHFFLERKYAIFGVEGIFADQPITTANLAAFSETLPGASYTTLRAAPGG